MTQVPGSWGYIPGMPGNPGYPGVSHAPQIPGLTYLQDLGHGGFADVYLYQSQSPLRLVAVKVLRDKQISENAARKLSDEANAMAALEHPYIVRVYSTGRTTDGRPYIEMAYYPQESLAEAVKRQVLNVPDVLKLGIQLASAIETAHRQNPPLLHRDIKPANILRDKFGDPALTDFGIASRLHDIDDEDTSLSVPWAPVEALFSTAPVDQRSDVYSLAATLWHLLVGRSPFEIPGGDNRPNMMMVRARDLPVPSTGRGDVPPPLDRLLQQAMSKDKRLRPASAADFARALQAIEQEMGMTPTPFKVAADPRPAPPPTADNEGTRRQTSGIVMDSRAVTGQRSGQAPPPPAPAAPPIPDYAEETRVRSRVELEESGKGKKIVDDTPEETTSHKAVLITGLVFLIVITLSIGTWLALGPTWPPWPESTPSPTITQAEPPGPVPPPGKVTISCKRSANGKDLTCTWDGYAYQLPTDSYLVLLPSGQETAVNTAQYQSKNASPNTCIAVRVYRADGSNATTTWSEKGCG